MAPRGPKADYASLNWRERFGFRVSYHYPKTLRRHTPCTSGQSIEVCSILQWILQMV